MIRIARGLLSLARALLALAWAAVLDRISPLPRVRPDCPRCHLPLDHRSHVLTTPGTVSYRCHRCRAASLWRMRAPVPHLVWSSQW